MKRKSLRLLAVITIYLASLSSFAGELKQVPLPTNPSFSVAVGVSGQWKSQIVQSGSRYRLFSADLSAYRLDEKSKVSNLLEHEFASPPNPTDKFWYGYYPVNDRVQLHINISSKEEKLGRLEVRCLVTNELIKTMPAVFGRSRFYGEFEMDPYWHHLRLDGFNANGKKIFTIGASLGEPLEDAFVKVVRYYKPSVKFMDEGYRRPVSDDLVPYQSVLSSTPVSSSLQYSRNIVHDNSASWQIWPLRESNLMQKRYLPTGQIIGLRSSATPANPICPSVDTPRIEDKKWEEDPVNIKPYSSNQFDIEFAVSGTVEVYIAMPYRVWRDRVLRDKVQRAFEKIADVAPLRKDKVFDNWKKSYTEWLKTKEGKESGLDADMVQLILPLAYEDAKVVKRAGP